MTTGPSNKLPCLRILKEVFNLCSFRESQEAIISSLLAGQDTLAVLPTGGGKSLCFSLPAVVRHRAKGQAAVVISPLISLMTEQTDRLNKLGLNVFRLGSVFSDDEVLYQIEQGKVELVFCSPEKFAALMERFKRLNELERISFFAIDEVHCVAEWGNDFRPDYKRLAEIKKCFEDVPILALSATITSSLKKAIETTLLGEDREFVVFATSMNRANLMIEVRPKLQQHDFVKYVKSLTGSGIIYCHTQDECNKLAATFEAAEIYCVVYHAGVVNRQVSQQLWTTNKRQWAIATVALGMGIDKGDTRHVIHLGIPLTLERYMQEIGRAGRDGLPASCVLFWGSKDETNLSFALKTEAAFEGIRLVREFCLLKAPGCRRQTLLAHFGEAFEKPDCQGLCDLCAPVKELASSEFGWFETLIEETVRASPGAFTVAKLRDAALGSRPLQEASKLNQTMRTKDKLFVDRLIERMITHGKLKEESQTFAKNKGFSLFFKTLTVTDSAVIPLGSKRPFSNI
jgi:ATP-dependent DNA helicase RecQ